MRHDKWLVLFGLYETHQFTGSLWDEQRCKEFTHWQWKCFAHTIERSKVSSYDKEVLNHSYGGEKGLLCWLFDHSQ